MNWTKSEDELPLPWTAVLAWGYHSDSNHERMMIAWRHDTEDLWKTGVDEGMCDDEVRLRVTHWMPIPPRPAP
jgi:hypothetical protein